MVFPESRCVPSTPQMRANDAIYSVPPRTAVNNCVPLGTQRQKKRAIGYAPLPRRAKTVYKIHRLADLLDFFALESAANANSN